MNLPLNKNTFAYAKVFLFFRIFILVIFYRNSRIYQTKMALIIQKDTICLFEMLVYFY